MDFEKLSNLKPEQKTIDEEPAKETEPKNYDFKSAADAKSLYVHYRDMDEEQAKIMPEWERLSQEEVSAASNLGEAKKALNNTPFNFDSPALNNAEDKVVSFIAETVNNTDEAKKVLTDDTFFLTSSEEERLVKKIDEFFKSKK